MTPTATTSVTAASAAGQGIRLTADTVTAEAEAEASTAPVGLCIGVLPLQQTVERGRAAEWVVAAWSTGGNVPNAAIQLEAGPAGSGTPQFSFGCGSDDGTSACALGTLDLGSPERQLQAQVTVPLTAATVGAVSLTATGSAANLLTDPTASAAVTVTATPTPVGATVPLPTINVPGVTAPTPTPALSSGSSASGLFPTIAPSSPGTAGAKPVADTSAISAGSNSLDPQIAGLAVLALAFALAITRLSLRRPAAAAPVPAPAVVEAAAPEALAESPGQPEGPGAELPSAAPET